MGQFETFLGASGIGIRFELNIISNWNIGSLDD